MARHQCDDAPGTGCKKLYVGSTRRNVTLPELDLKLLTAIKKCKIAQITYLPEAEDFEKPQNRTHHQTIMDFKT